ncbi:MAG: DUF393 domain-containing protein [Dehalococcoidia bacterium]|nr:DUF393 domain-containing protein [Dehalococcoidia bacterium]
MELPTLIYDGSCGVCAATVRWLERRGAARTLAFRTYQDAPPQMGLAGLTPHDCQCAAYVVDDRGLGQDCLDDGAVVRVYRGAGAVNFALRALPGARHIGWRLLGWLYYLPLLRRIEDLAYAWFARNRFRFGGSTCGLKANSR